jgi:hypothetical protein
METREATPTLAYANRVPPRPVQGLSDQALADQVTTAMSDLGAAIAAARATGLRVDLDFERVPGRLPELGPEAETLVGTVDIYRALA